MSVEIREMVLDDYENVYELWLATEGLSLNEDDRREGILLYLARNPGLCFVATLNGKIVGSILSGHDGRRGIVRHLAVAADHRGVGTGRRLVRAALDGLAAHRIKKCNTFVMDHNSSGMRFWEYIGFCRLEDNYRTLQFLTDSQFKTSSE